MLNKSIGELIDFQHYLENVLASYTKITVDDNGNQIEPFTTTEGLFALLQSIPGIGAGNVSSTLDADAIRYTIHLDRQYTKTVPLALGIDSKISLDVTGSIMATLDTALDLTFGVAKDSGLFFIEDKAGPVFTVSGTVTTDIDLATKLGFLGVTITDGMASMAASLALDLRDTNADDAAVVVPEVGFDPPASPGKITQTELTLAAIPAIVTASLTGNASASLPLTATVGADYSRSGTLAVSWPNLAVPASFTLDTSQIADMFKFNELSAANLLDGLRALPSMLRNLAGAGAFGKDVPLLGSSLRQLITLGDKVQEFLDKADAFTTVQGMETALENVLNNPLLPVTVDVTINPDDVQFALRFERSVSDTLNFNVDRGITIGGGGPTLGFQVNGQIDASGAIGVDLRMGLSFASGLAPTERFYILAGSDSAADLRVKVTTPSPFNATASLGLLTVGIQGGTATVAGKTGGAIDPSKDATFHLQLADPGTGAAADGKITLGELLSPSSALKVITNATTTINGAAKIELPLAPISGVTPAGANPKLTLNWADLGNLSSLTVTDQDLDSYLAGATNFNADTALAGIEAIINLIQGWSNVDLMNTKIPFINKKLSDVFDFASKALAFFNAIKSASPGNSTAFDTAVMNALSAAGLSDAAVKSITPSSNSARHDPANGRFEYKLHLEFDLLRADESLSFDGLPFNFAFEGTVKPHVTFTLDLGFGMNPDEGFFLVDSQAINPASPPELQLDAGIAATFDKIGGSFGPIAYGVRNGTGDISFHLDVDLKDPNNSGGRITPSEILGNFTSVVRPSLGGSAGLMLPIGLRLGETGPGVTTTFQLGWDASQPSTVTFGPSGSTDPANAFTAVSFEMGEVVGDVIGPILQKIKTFNPLPQELIDLMLTPLPIINQTPLDLLAGATGAKEIKLLFQIAQVVNSIPTGGNAIDLSPFFADEEAPGNAGSGSPTGGNSGPFDSFLMNLKNNFDITLPIIDSNNDGSFDAGNVIQILLGQDVDLIRWNPAPFSFTKDFEIRFPILSYGIPFIANATIYGSIIGGFGFFGDLDLGLSSRGITHVVNTGDPLDILDGFFIGDNKPDPNGEDQFEVGFTAYIGLEISGVITILGWDGVKVYGRGGVRGIIGLDLADVQYDATGAMVGRVGRLDDGGDNRIYLDEINYLIQNYGFQCTLTLGGTLEAFLGIGAKLSLPWPLPDIDLYSEVTFPIANWELPCDPLPPTPVAEKNGNALTMYPDADTEGKIIQVVVRRDSDGTPQSVRITKSSQSGTNYEDYSLTDPAAAKYIGAGSGINTLFIEGTDGDDTISIDPALTDLTGIQYIHVDAKGGNDDIDFGLIKPEDAGLLGTTIDGGSGDDTIKGTFAPDSIIGGEGNDVITGDDGNDTIYGGLGDDVLSGGAGDDSIFGEAGADQIYGHSGHNYLDGGTEADTINGGDDGNEVWGGSGADQISTGSGADVIHGGLGNDRIFAGAGNNTITGDEDPDYIDAGDGNDTITGGTGADEIHAGGGNNVIQGNSGADMIYAGAGNDNIDAGTENDTVDAGGGNNTVLGGDGHDIITTGSGGDSIDAGPGNDRVTTSGGNNTIYGRAGLDTIISGAGIDWIDAGTENDNVSAGDGNNTIFGGDGNDTIVSGAGNDSIDAGLNDDSVTAGNGNNTVLGVDGNDTIVTGTGNDSIDAGSGNDSVTAGNGRNRIFGRTGNDTIVSGNEEDYIEGGDDNDSITADDGKDTIYGGAGNDTIYAGRGMDMLYGGTGNDLIHGGEQDDYFESDLGDDTLFGEDGNDLLVQVVDADQTLTQTSLTGLGSDTLDGKIERVFLFGGASNNAFDVTGWTGIAHLDGGGGTDRVVSSNDADFLLADWSLTRTRPTDVSRFELTSIERATLTGGPSRNLFDIERWTGQATLDAGDGEDLLQAEIDTDFTLTDASLVVATGALYTLAGFDRVQLTGGPGANKIDASGFSGPVSLYGLGGNDTLLGGSGDDLLDGGAGIDSLVGNAGLDELIAGPGTSATLDGGPGNDILRGSPDGADSITGGAGRDHIFGYGGNDFIDAGAESDTVEGGDGDDAIYGGAGSDLIVGGLGHDVIYGHSLSGAGDDSAIDYLYGDLGTNGNEPGSGRDRLFGQGGNDYLFGEGNDDFIDAGAGTSNIVDYGTGESGNPADFVPPTGTPAPSPISVTPTIPPATLPTLPDALGRWTELGGTATGGGLSGDPGLSFEPSIVAGAASQFVAWADNRSGRFAIYVARHDTTGWAELAGSAHGSGISSPGIDARQPSLTLDASGNPVVAWIEAGDVHAARFDPTAGGGAGGWVALGSGVVSTSGLASHPSVVRLAGSLAVAWLDTTSGVANVYASTFNGSTWSPLVAGATSGQGISGSASAVTDLAVATDGGTKVAFAWSQSVGGTRQIYLRQYDGGTLAALGGSASGGGLSNTSGNSVSPTLAYQGSSLFAAWQTVVSGKPEIYAARFNGSAWVDAGAGSRSGGGVSQTGGASAPRLASGGGALQLLWTNDRVSSLTGNTVNLYARRWNGSAFVEEVPGDASGRGVATVVNNPASLTLAVDAAGHPFAAWTDASTGTAEINVRANTAAAVNRVFYVNDGLTLGDSYATIPGNDANDGLAPNRPKASIQAVLDAYDLGPGDVILVDAGTYSGTVTLSANDAGVAIVGATDMPTILSGLVTIDGADGVGLKGLVLNGGVQVTASSDVAIEANTIGGAGVVLSGGAGTRSCTTSLTRAAPASP